jgi:hypothetical protein
MMQTNKADRMPLPPFDRREKRVALLPFLMMLSGCGRAPTFSILGSFFPAWLACIILGIVMAALVYWFLTRYKLDDRLAWPTLVYPCLAALFAFTLWLLFFS